jgi:hypothetical protein
LNEKPTLTELARNLNRSLVVADENRHDRSDRLSANLNSARAEPPAKSFSEVQQAMSGVLRLASHTDILERQPRDYRRGPRGEHEAPRTIPKPLSQPLASRNESALNSYGFPESTEQCIRSDSVRPAKAAAFRAKDAQSVRFVDDQAGASFIADPSQTEQVWAIAIHAEIALGDDPPSLALSRSKLLIDRVDVPVRNDSNLGSRKPASVDQGSVVERVRDNDVFAADERAQQSNTRRVTGGEEKRPRELNPIRDLGF